MNEDSREPMDQLSAHLDRCRDLLERGDLAGAMLSAQKSLELDAESPEAHNLVGYILAAEGRPDDALSHYRRAIEADESYVQAMLNAADVLLFPIDDADEALRTIDEALDWIEESDVDEMADAMLLKAEALMALGQRPAASAIIARLPNGPFQNPNLSLSVGRARLELGELSSAQPLLEAASAHPATAADAHYSLGILYDTRSEHRNATVAFLRSRELEIERPSATKLPRAQFESRVQSAMKRLASRCARVLDGALVVVCDLPGAEVIASGGDPRTQVFFDDIALESKDLKVGRVFVYQRNVERTVTSVLDVEDEIRGWLEHELTDLMDNGRGAQKPPPTPSADAHPGAAQSPGEVSGVLSLDEPEPVPGRTEKPS